MLVLVMSAFVVAASTSVVVRRTLAEARLTFGSIGMALLLRLTTIAGLSGRQQQWTRSMSAPSLVEGSTADSYTTLDEEQQLRNVSAGSGSDASALSATAADAATAAPAPAPSARSANIETAEHEASALANAAVRPSAAAGVIGAPGQELLLGRLSSPQAWLSALHSGSCV